MIKLLDILLESIEESKPITLDKSVFTQIDKIYDKFINLEDKDIVQTLEEKGSIFLGHIEFKNPYNNDPEKIEVSLYNISEDDANATYDPRDRSIKVYYDALKKGSHKKFVNSVYHELVHSVDPKTSYYLRSRKELNNLFSLKKYKQDMSSDLVRYLKAPEEFDAWSSTFVNFTKEAIENLPEELKSRVKSDLRKITNGLIALLSKFEKGKYGNFDDETLFTITKKFKEEYSSQISNIKKTIFDDEDSVLDGLFSIIFYLNKPYLFKKYIQRLSALL